MRHVLVVSCVFRLIVPLITAIFALPDVELQNNPLAN